MLSQVYDSDLVQHAWSVHDVNDELHEHVNVEYNHHGEVDEWTPRYILEEASHYSRIFILPVPAPEYAVPIRQGFFTAISAWVFQDEEPIKQSRQLVLLDYTEGKKEALGRHITVF